MKGRLWRTPPRLKSHNLLETCSTGGRRRQRRNAPTSTPSIALRRAALWTNVPNISTPKLLEQLLPGACLSTVHVAAAKVGQSLTSFGSALARSRPNLAQFGPTLSGRRSARKNKRQQVFDNAPLSAPPSCLWVCSCAPVCVARRRPRGRCRARAAAFWGAASRWVLGLFPLFVLGV